ncbi:MAG TPA: hypothetical protein GXX57_09890 [Firmicutes bacterium]|nr:hypothetical protein [Bacillota bacterium]
MEQAVKEFTLEFFATLGAALHDQGGLLRVQLTDDQVSEIENRFSKPAVWEFVFTKEDLDRYPQAELLRPGSRRLDQLIDTAAHKGWLCRRYISKGASVLRPHILFHFRLTFTGSHQPDRLLSLGVDLTRGILVEDLAKQVEREQGESSPPAGVTLLPRKIGYRRAYRLACEGIKALLQAEDHRWAESAALSLTQERRHLQEHYRRLQEQQPGQDLAKELETRLREQEQRFSPKILAYPVATELVFLPEN